jgi:serine/threonine protein kinase
MNALSQPDDIRDSLPARESVMRLEAGDLLYDHSGGSSYVIVEPRSGQAEVTNRFDVVVYEGPEARLYQALQLSQAGKTLRDPARVALKIAINHGFNGQISAEAQRQSQLSQRAKGEVIAPVIDQGEHQGHVFYTTPWYSQTLDSWLEQAAPDLIQRLGALARLCQATTALHTADAQGLRIVHGDIKPQNIAILAEGPRQILRFLDLGTTRQTSERTVGPLGARAYSLGYSPPGQLIPGAPTLRSDDAFAVAACLFRALSGHRPACASLDYRAAIRRDAPWEQTDKAGDPALFFRLKVFYELLEVQDLPGLQEQVSEEALKALQGQDDGAQDPALAQHQQALAQQVAERLVTLVRDGLQPEPRKRRQDWLEDAARELEALVALLLRRRSRRSSGLRRRRPRRSPSRRPGMGAGLWRRGLGWAWRSR